MASTYINTANMGTTNTYTISFWFKRSGLGTTQRLFTPFEATENDQDGIYINSSDKLSLKKSGTTDYEHHLLSLEILQVGIIFVLEIMLVQLIIG